MTRLLIFAGPVAQLDLGPQEGGAIFLDTQGDRMSPKQPRGRHHAGAIEHGCSHLIRRQVRMSRIRKAALSRASRCSSGAWLEPRAARGVTRPLAPRPTDGIKVINSLTPSVRTSHGSA